MGVVTHSAQSSHRERSRGAGKGAREESVKESIDLKVRDQTPAKAVTGSFPQYNDSLHGVVL